jgi:hypothetical protein
MAVGLGLGDAAHLRVDAIKDAEFILHVVPHHVGYHVGLGEVARSSETVASSS